MGERSAEEVRNALQALYAQWFAAIPHDKEGLFDRILSDDWHYTNFVGEVRGKSEYKEYIKAVDPARGPRDLSELQVRIFGDVVVVHGRYVVPGGDSEADRDVRFTAVWIERPAGWQSLAHHATLVTLPA
jgi:ketosteroid isomerase-like protein